VILVDLNLLIYAYNIGGKEYSRASSWLTNAMTGRERVGLPWAAVIGFIRIATTPRIFAAPYELDDAIAIVSAWLARENVVLVSPGERHWTVLGELLNKSQARGPLITDAHLAALAIEHGATFCTNDRDFLRFPGLKLEFPLQ
jgi:uncharacterized protein